MLFKSLLLYYVVIIVKSLSHFLLDTLTVAVVVVVGIGAVVADDAVVGAACGRTRCKQLRFTAHRSRNVEREVDGTTTTGVGVEESDRCFNSTSLVVLLLWKGCLPLLPLNWYWTFGKSNHSFVWKKNLSQSRLLLLKVQQLAAFYFAWMMRR